MAALAQTLAYLVFNRFPGWQTLGTVVVALAAWGLFHRLGAVGPGSRRERVLRFAQRPGALVVIPALLSFAATALLALHRGVPLPYVHDEYSYLLAADTFAQGRLTNPAPAVAEPFETMHVLVSPTYQSKYPPAQGLFMALGQVVFGHPIWGVWISGACAVAACAWALRAVLPSSWALLGGLILAIHPQMLEWGQRYWGGYPAVLGGALLLGGVLRLQRGGRGRDGALAAAGMLVLACSRPFEGLVLTVLLATPLLFHLPRLRAVLAMGVVLAVGFAWMGYYNFRVTGNWVRLPYQEHQAQYGAAPLFIFQPLPERPHYNHPELAKFYGQDQVYEHVRVDSPRAHAIEVWSGVRGLWLTWFGNASVLAIGLLALPAAWVQSRKVRVLSVVLVVFCAVLLTETFLFGHYAAPAAALVCAWTVLLLRKLWQYPIGQRLAVSALAVFGLWAIFWWIGFFGWEQDPASFQARRANIERALAEQPGKHLALVRYGPGHDVHQEWVFNRADLEEAPVLWAREMPGTDIQKKLLSHYKGRSIWRVDVDPDQARLSRYP